MIFFKENWFKLAILAIIVYLALTVPFSFLERKLWTEERLKAYEMCLDIVLPNASNDISKAGYTSYYDAFKAAFRACKNTSDNF